jgi:hypothetical protein
MRLIYKLTYFALLLPLMVNSQELNCQIQIIAPTLQSNPANQDIFDGLQEQATEFLNYTKWTNHIYSQQERIECSILIRIDDKQGSDDFRGSIQISASRPVFNSNYKTPILNWVDNSFNFRYQRNAPFLFTPDRHQNNLTSVLAFYAYMILGYDYDSFSLEGGTPFFVKAQNIVANAQNAPESGWRANENDRNRYWLVENALQNVFNPLRVCYYNYHRLGFDMLYDKRDEAVTKILESLELIREIHKIRPNSFNVQVFFATKVDELVNLFIEAQPDVRARVFQLLKEVDPTRISKYQKIQRGKQ